MRESVYAMEQEQWDLLKAMVDEAPLNSEERAELLYKQRRWQASRNQDAGYATVLEEWAKDLLDQKYIKSRAAAESNARSRLGPRGNVRLATVSRKSVAPCLEDRPWPRKSISSQSALASARNRFVSPTRSEPTCLAKVAEEAGVVNQKLSVAYAIKKCDGAVNRVCNDAHHKALSDVCSTEEGVPFPHFGPSTIENSSTIEHSSTTELSSTIAIWISHPIARLGVHSDKLIICDASSTRISQGDERLVNLRYLTPSSISRNRQYFFQLSHDAYFILREHLHIQLIVLGCVVLSFEELSLMDILYL
jgi:hypothetical protein